MIDTSQNELTIDGLGSFVAVSGRDCWSCSLQSHCTAAMLFRIAPCGSGTRKDKREIVWRVKVEGSSK
jgi:hypothetical protein